jgi:Holliday junction resolvase RusA-like endonuclease
MEKTINIFLPCKPLSVNRCWQGRRFKSKDYKAFEIEICSLLPIATKTITGPVTIEYNFYLKNFKMTDADNLVKPIQDIIVKRGYIKDDRIIWRYVITKHPLRNDIGQQESIGIVIKEE